MIGRLCVVKRKEFIVPIRLTNGAYVMYQQLSEERNNDFGCIKEALYKHFAADSFTAHERFEARRLDLWRFSLMLFFVLFLAELLKLSVLFYGIPEQG